MNEREFLLLWDRVITKQAYSICFRNPGLVFAEYLKDSIFMDIMELINYCKQHYMKDPNKFIDRHKVAAAVIIAILKNTPIKLASSVYYTTHSKSWLFNEQLAITTALSVLKSFICADIRTKYGHNKNKCDFYLDKLKDGIIYPKTRHGDYRDNWANELYHTRKSGSYNLLALAHELFFLEINTIQY